MIPLMRQLRPQHLWHLKDVDQVAEPAIRFGRPCWGTRARSTSFVITSSVEKENQKNAVSTYIRFRSHAALAVVRDSDDHRYSSEFHVKGWFLFNQFSDYYMDPTLPPDEKEFTPMTFVSTAPSLPCTHEPMIFNLIVGSPVQTMVVGIELSVGLAILFQAVVW